MSEEKIKDIPVASLIVKGNTLIYENEAIQINTLTAIWIDDLTEVVKHPFPSWIKIVATVGGLAVVLGLLSHEPILMAIGVVLASVSISRFTKYVPSSKKPRFALGIEKASGESIRFPSSNKEAVNEVANALFNCISSKEELFDTIVMNPDKKAPVKKSLGSQVFFLKKKPATPAAAGLYKKKPTEKLVENIKNLKPEAPEPAPPPPPPPEPKKEEKPAEEEKEKAEAKA